MNDNSLSEQKDNTIHDFCCAYAAKNTIPITLYNNYGKRIDDTVNVLPLRTWQSLCKAAKSVYQLYEELTDIVEKDSEILRSYFGFSDSEMMMWVLSFGNWSGISRADVFETEDGKTVVAELNSDTPSGMDEAYVLGQYVDSGTGYLNINGNLEKQVVSLVLHEWQQIEKIEEMPRVGIVYPTDIPEDYGMISLYRRWLEKAGCKVVLGSPFNLHLNARNRVEMFGFEMDVMIRHYKTDWWVEQKQVWKDEKHNAEGALYRELHTVLEPYKSKKLSIINPFGAVLSQNKSTYAFFHENNTLFSPNGQRIIAKLIPYTIRLTEVNVSKLKSEKEVWVLKSIYGCEGDNVIIGKEVTKEEWISVLDTIIPERWIAQEKFVALKEDNYYHNYGIYMVHGKVAGVYLRRSQQHTDINSTITPVGVRVPLSQKQSDLKPISCELQNDGEFRCYTAENHSEWSFLRRNLIVFSDKKEITNKTFDLTEETTYNKASECLRKYMSVISLTKDKTLFVCDLPGEKGVAFCSQLHQYAEVIIHFNNVAHEFEEIPCTRTISALRYYSSAWPSNVSGEKKNPIIVVERNRLNALTNSKKFFNNRYMIELPTIDVLSDKGISSIVYIKPRKEDTVLKDCMEYFKYYSGSIKVFSVSIEEMMETHNKVFGEIMNEIRNFDEYVS